MQSRTSGEMIEKKVGGKASLMGGDAFLQKVDYLYNIRGWLTDINNVNSLAEPNAPQDLFAFKLNYNAVQDDMDGMVKPLYNGNISETFWRTSSDNIKRKYGYRYDYQNRILGAYYQLPSTAIKRASSYNAHYSYDSNGNLLSLKRNGIQDIAHSVIEMDDLTYTYDLGNKLKKVSDATSYSEGYNDYHTDVNVDDFEYDDYGNMIVNRDKRILNIQYNHLNLPTKITFAGLGTIEYLYDAIGTKLQKTVVDNNSSTSSSQYRKGFQYTDGALDFFPTAEGYVKVLNSGNTQKYHYVYNFTDHLGNIRLKYTLHPQTNVLSILEEDHYYPYGLKHEGYNPLHEIVGIDGQVGTIILMQANAVLGDSYKYKFGGMEYSDEFDINTYDFGARNYDPALGRWMNMDPLAEMMRRHSPYNYAFNNPIFWIDPDGMRPRDSSDGYTPRSSGTAKSTATERYDFGSIQSDNTFDSASSGDSNNAQSGASTNAAAYSKAFKQAGEDMANADLSIMSEKDENAGCTPPCGGGGNINWNQVITGSASMLGGTLLTVSGGAAVLTGVGAPAGGAGIIIGVPAIGFGFANVIEGFRGGEQSIPHGLFEAVDVGFNGDGTFGQMTDVFSGGLPKNITTGVIMGIGLYNSNVGQGMINTSSRRNFSSSSNSPREILQDNTRVRKPLINY